MSQIARVAPARSPIKENPINRRRRNTMASKSRREIEFTAMPLASLKVKSSMIVPLMAPYRLVQLWHWTEVRPETGDREITPDLPHRALGHVQHVAGIQVHVFA